MPIEPLSTIIAWVVGICGIIACIFLTVSLIIFALGTLIEFFSKSDSKEYYEI